MYTHNTHYTHKHKDIAIPETFTGECLTWLEYKKQNRIVNYYPTLKQYERYYLHALSVSKLPQGYGCKSWGCGLANLKIYLKNRLQG